MSFGVNQMVLLFLALFALYSPIAAMASYLPIVGPFKPADQRRLAFGMFVYVLCFALGAIWVGEPVLELLGISVAALTATGGIALVFEGVHLMQGSEDPSEEEMNPKPLVEGEEQPAPVEAAPVPGGWRSVLFTPLFFPLTVGGTTFGLFVAYRAQAENTGQVLGLSVAGLAYAAVTGLTLYAAGHVNRRVSPKGRMILGRVAGILLTSIAVMLLASGGTRLVVDVLRSMNVLQ